MMTNFKGPKSGIVLLAMFCMERLIGKGHDDVFLKYCNRRIEVIEKTPGDSTQRYRLTPLKEWSERLTNR